MSATHEVQIHDGPCDKQGHSGAKCRERWFTCSCFTPRRIEMVAKRHDLDDARALEWVYDAAREHMRNAV